MITNAKTPIDKNKIRIQSPNNVSIPRPNENGEGKIYYYGLIGTRDYYHKKDVKQGKVTPGRFSASEEKSQDLHPSKIYVSTSPILRSNNQSQNQKGGIVRLRKRRKQKIKSEMEKILMIQKWWRSVIRKKSELHSIQTKKEKTLFQNENGGIISLLIDRSCRFMVNTQETPINKQIIFTTDCNLNSSEKKTPQIVDEDRIMIRKILPISIDKSNKTNYDQYCQQYVLSQMTYKAPGGKALLKNKKQTNNQLIKQQMRDIWLKEAQNEGKESFSIQNNKKSNKISLVTQSLNHFDIKGKQILNENRGSNTLNWNDKITKDSDISLYLQRIYKMKNWNKINNRETFTLELQNTRSIVQGQINYLHEQCHKISLKGKLKPNWNQINFAERFDLTFKQNKMESKLLISNALSIMCKPTYESKNYIYGIVLTKEQIKQREKQLKIQNDQLNINYNPDFSKWNKLNKKHSNQNQHFIIKSLYKKANWNKTNISSNTMMNQLFGKEKDSNQYIKNVQFTIEDTPYLKIEKWKEIVLKTKQDSFNMNQQYFRRKDWNKTNKPEKLISFNEEGVENNMKFLQDLFFSISAKGNDYEIIFTDKEKGNLFKLTKRDIMHLWNKFNNVEYINHEDSNPIESKYQVVEPEYIPKQIERVKAAPGKKRNDNQYEIEKGTYFSLASKRIKMGNDLWKIENNNKHNIKLLGEDNKDKWNKRNKPSEIINIVTRGLENKDKWNNRNKIQAINNIITYEGQEYQSKWNGRNKSQDFVNIACKDYDSKDKWNSRNKIQDIIDITCNGQEQKDKWNGRNKSQDIIDITCNGQEHKEKWNGRNKTQDIINIACKGQDHKDKWNNRNKSQELINLAFKGEEHKEKWNNKNKKVNELDQFIIARTTILNDSLIMNLNNKNKAIIENNIFCKGESHVDTWNKTNVKEESKINNINYKGSSIPNYNLLFEYWNHKNKFIEEEISLNCPAEDHHEKWNQENEIEHLEKELFIKGSTHFTIFLLLQHWNNSNQAINKENDIYLKGKEYESCWNKINKIKEDDIDFFYLGENHKDKWNKSNKKVDKKNEVNFEGLLNPNISLIISHWNKLNKTVMNESRLFCLGKNQEKWNKTNKSVIEESNVCFLGDDINSRWNRKNEKEICNTICLEGSRDPNIVLVLERWNRKNIKEDNGNNMTILGENLKIKWNNCNNKEKDVNQICIEGSRNPNLVLVWEYWSKRNQKIFAEIQFSLLKDDCQDKWNKCIKKDHQINELTIKGLTDPNIMLLLEHWNKRNKRVKEGTEIYIIGKDNKEQWIKTIKPIIEETQLYISGGDLKEKWNKSNKPIADETQLYIPYRVQKVRWNQISKPIIQETQLNITCEDPKVKWNKLNKSIEDKTQVYFTGEDPKIKWNKINKLIAEETKLIISCEDNKIKWNKINKSIVEETQLYIPYKDPKEKWNQINQITDETMLYIQYRDPKAKWNKSNNPIAEETQLYILCEDPKIKWNKINKNSQIINDIIIEGSKNLNDLLILEYFKNRNIQIERENKFIILGEDQKQKWNKNNIKVVQNQVNIVGLKDPNIILILEYWNKHNRQIKEANQFYLLGKNTKDRWNISNNMNAITIKGSITPNQYYMLQYWKKVNQPIEEENEVCLLSENNDIKWNRYNIAEVQPNAITYEGSHLPNLILVLEWNKRNKKQVDVGELHYSGECLKEKWNKKNKEDNITQINFLGQPPTIPNVVLVAELWKKRNQKSTEETKLQFKGENKSDKWNRENIADANNGINECVMSLSTKDKWNKANKEVNEIGNLGINENDDIKPTTVHILKSTKKPKEKEVILDMASTELFDIPRTRQLNPMRFNINDTWKEKVSKENSFSFNIEKKERLFIPYEGDKIEILNHKKKTRLNENKEKRRWDDDPSISKNEPFELFPDESEIKEKKERLRRKNIVKNMKIEQSYAQLLNKPKTPRFNRDKLLTTNLSLEIDSKGKEDLVLLWNQQNKIKEESKDFHISKKYDKPVKWNTINTIQENSLYSINKKPKKTWNEQLEKTSNEILISPQIPNIRWNKNNEMISFVYQIKAEKKLTWNNIVKDSNLNGFNIQAHKKQTWNVIIKDSDATGFNIKAQKKITWSNIIKDTNLNRFYIEAEKKPTWNNIIEFINTTGVNLKAQKKPTWNDIIEDVNITGFNIKGQKKSTWNDIIEDNNTTGFIIKEQKKSTWNDIIEDNNTTGFNIKAQKKSTWNDIIEDSNTTGFNIKSQKKPTWNERNENDKSCDLVFKGKKKPKWNEIIEDDKSNSFVLKGKRLKDKWNQNNTLSHDQFSALSKPKTIINRWNTLNNQTKETRFKISSQTKKPNEIKYENQLQIINKPKKKVSCKLIRSASLAIVPSTKVNLKKLNENNKIANSVVNYCLKGIRIKKQWSSKTLNKQHQSLNYKGKSKEDWNKIIKQESKERVQLEGTRKDWNDLKSVHQTNNNYFKQGKSFKKTQLQVKSFEYEYIKKEEDIGANKIKIKISELEKKEMDDDDDLLNNLHASKEKNKKIDYLFSQIKNQSQHNYELPKEDVKEETITPVKQKTDQPKVRKSNKPNYNPEKELSSTYNNQYIPIQPKESYYTKDVKDTQLNKNPVAQSQNINYKRDLVQRNSDIRNVTNLLKPPKNKQEGLQIQLRDLPTYNIKK